jgi:integrase
VAQVDLSDLAKLIAAQADELRALRAAVQQQQREIGSDLTLGQLYDAYEPTIRRLRSHRTAVSVMRAPVAHFRDVLVLSVRPSDWTRYRDDVRSKPKDHGKKPPSPGTLNQELRYLRIMCNWAIADGRIGRNPFAKIKTLPVAERDTVVPEDKDAAVVGTAHPVLAAMYIVAVDTGMRKDEIRTLERANVDLVRGVITLPWTATKTKKARQPRLSERAIAAIKALPHVLDSDFVFASPRTKRPYSMSAVDKWWYAARADAKLVAAPGDGRVHFHDLRHTAATRMTEDSPVPVVMAQIGHRSVKSAMRYMHATGPALDGLKAKLDQRQRRGPHGAQRDVHESTEVKSGKATTR